VVKKLWDTVDAALLKSLPNAGRGFEQQIDIPEFTFLGVAEQPDFGHIKMWFYGEEKTIELKSLKEYLYQFRDTIISYERCMSVLYEHLMAAYEPARLRLEIEFRPRGGISSKLVADSDWGHLGGSDKIWQHHA
jgi:7-cyano-7-deazaguanine reductase